MHQRGATLQSSLVLLVSILVGWLSVVNGFSNTAPWRGSVLVSQRTTRYAPLFMVSKKEKRRRQEGQARTAVFQKAEVLKQQRLLVTKLQELQKDKSGAAVAHKLLKSTIHDGLDDFGREARQLALELFYSANRPSDAITVLSSIPSVTNTDTQVPEEQEELDQFGLWAHSTLGDWSKAAQCAHRIYDLHEHQSTMQDGPFSTSNEQRQQRQSAIQAFTHSGEHLELARQLFRLQEDGPQITNSMLESYLRDRRFQEAKELWEDTESHADAYDQGSHRLMLKCGVQSGDVALIETVLGYLGEATTMSELLLVLEGLVAATMPKSLARETLAVTTFQEIVKKSKQKSREKEAQLEPALLSRLLEITDRPQSLKVILEACRSYYSNRGSTKNWIASLRPVAKAQLLPLLVLEERALPESAERPKTQKYKESWKLMNSLMKIGNPKKTRDFLHEQSKSFCIAALEVAHSRWNDERGFDLASMIVQHRWKTLVIEPVADDALYRDLGDAINLLFDVLPFMFGSDESKKIDLFKRVVRALSIEFTSHLAPGQERPVEQQHHHQVFFSNPKLDSIVSANSELLQAVKAAASSTENAPLAMSYSYFAKEASQTAMLLISALPEFSLAAFWDRGGKKVDDNQSKEAIQAIMKELLEVDPMPNDDLTYPARTYYMALARVAQSWPNSEDQENLLFPVSSGLTSSRFYEDPYATFRNCVMDEKTSDNKSPGFLNRVLTWMDDDDGELSMLLPCVLEMGSQSDARTGSSHRSDFVDDYREFLVKDLDLVMDLSVLISFCNALELENQLASLPMVSDTDFQFFLWDIELAKAAIEKLASCQHASRWAEAKVTTREDLDGDAIQMLTGYLISMYTVAGAFSRIVDKEGNSLTQSYLDACHANSRYIVSFVAHKGTTRPKINSGTRRGRRERSSTFDEYMNHLSFVAMEILQYISKVMNGDDGDFRSITAHYGMEDGRLQQSLLVVDVLSAFHDQLPRLTVERQEVTIRNIIKDVDLHPVLLETASAWVDAKFGDEAE